MCRYILNAEKKIEKLNEVQSMNCIKCNDKLNSVWYSRKILVRENIYFTNYYM